MVLSRPAHSLPIPSLSCSPLPRTPLLPDSHASYLLPPLAISVSSFGRWEDVEGTDKVLGDGEHGCGVVKLPAVVRRTKDGHQLAVGKEFIAVLDHLSMTKEHGITGEGERVRASLCVSVSVRVSVCVFVSVSACVYVHACALVPLYKPWHVTSINSILRHARKLQQYLDTLYLVGPADEAEALLGQEVGYNVRAKGEACATVILAPAHDAGIRVRPQ